MLLLASSNSRKHLVSRFWLSMTAGWRTPRRHTSHQRRPSILRAVVACGEPQLPASEVRTFCWGSFFVSFCVPQILTTAVPQSPGVDLCREQEGRRSEETHSICGFSPFPMGFRVCVPRSSRSSKRNVLTYRCVLLLLLLSLFL